jgi:hypothetical protein
MTTMCGRAFGFWKIKPAVAVVILLAVAATLGSVPAAAGTPVVPLKTQAITPPYACAPYGYYGPEWFMGGVFVGAGPWFHWPEHFRGHVDGRFDVQRGYRGPVPNHGDDREPSKRLDQIDHFRGNEMRDGRGHVGGGRR